MALAGYPQTEHFRFQPWPEDDEGVSVEFRLVYRGPLPAQGSGSGKGRSKEKHAIRKQFNVQLRELWKQHWALQPYIHEVRDDSTGEFKSYAREISKQYQKGAFRFLPLISKRKDRRCALDILFLRRDNPGNLISSGGDLDNRIKVLFDGLRVPEYDDEIRGESVGQNEDPFYVLLQDDVLIADVKITTDRLLVPPADDEHIHDVHLIIHVDTRMVDDRP